MFTVGKFINQSSNFPKIENTNERVFSQFGSYQMVEILVLEVQWREEQQKN